VREGEGAAVLSLGCALSGCLSQPLRTTQRTDISHVQIAFAPRHGCLPTAHPLAAIRRASATALLRQEPWRLTREYSRQAQIRAKRARDTGCARPVTQVAACCLAELTARTYHSIAAPKCGTKDRWLIISTQTLLAVLPCMNVASVTMTSTKNELPGGYTCSACCGWKLKGPLC
jgi:hypothetical protein